MAFFFTSYLNLANLLNLTPEIIDRLFNAYQTDLPWKVDVVDEVGVLTPLSYIVAVSFIGGGNRNTRRK